jgi:thiol-disulfide isomerase/thioredoxin
MNKLRFLPVLVGLALAGAVYGTTPKAATSMVDDAVKTAKAEHKGVLVIFHASWCGWCKQLDKTLEVPAFKSVLDKDFVVLHVTVYENKAHKADENPGGADLISKLGGADSGLPFYAVVNSDGEKVADSKLVEQGQGPHPQNMGFPTEPVELDHFVQMLQAGNPEMTAQDAATLHKVLEDRAAEIKAKLAHH